MFAFLCAFLVAVAFDASPVFAHNKFDSSSPSSGETLASSPATWSITFTKSVPLNSASGAVVNGDGVRTVLGTPVHGDTDKTIVFTFPSGLSGAVTARWRLVANDGHVISGRVSFTVQAAQPGVTTTIPSAQPGGATTVPSTTPQQVNGDADDFGGFSVPEPVRVGVRMVGFLSILLLGGLFFAEWYIAEGSFTTLNGRRLLRVSAVGLSVAPIAQYIIFLNDIRGIGGSFASAIGDSFSMGLGFALVVRSATGVAVALFVRNVLRHGIRLAGRVPLMATLAVVHLFALAYAGHSRTEGVAWLGVPTDVLHVAAAAVWLGGLVSVILVVAPVVNAAQGIVAFDRFGYAAERAIAVIVVTGIIQSLRLHGDIASIFTTWHGVLLLAKVALVVVIVQHAARNRRVLARNRALESTRPGVARTVIVQAALTESALGVAVVIISAVIVAISPG